MQGLVREAISHGHRAVDHDTLAAQVRLFRPAVLAGASQTAARSGCLRTLTGARQFCAIRSYLSTAAKHSLDVFDSLVMLTKGRPWMPAAA